MVLGIWVRNIAILLSSDDYRRHAGYSFSSKVSPQKLLAFGLAVDSLAMIAIGLSTDYWFTLGLQFICGLAMPCIQIGINTMILKNTEESFIGRVNGILTPLFMGSMVFSMMLSGTIKNAISLFPLLSDDNNLHRSFKHGLKVIQYSAFSY